MHKTSCVTDATCWPKRLVNGLRCARNSADCCLHTERSSSATARAAWHCSWRGSSASSAWKLTGQEGTPAAWDATAPPIWDRIPTPWICTWSSWFMVCRGQWKIESMLPVSKWSGVKPRRLWSGRSVSSGRHIKKRRETTGRNWMCSVLETRIGGAQGQDKRSACHREPFPGMPPCKAAATRRLRPSPGITKRARAVEAGTTAPPAPSAAGGRPSD